MTAMTALSARAQLGHEHEARRSAEAACALDFLVYGDGEPSTFLGHHVVGVSHAERCLFVMCTACHQAPRKSGPCPERLARRRELEQRAGAAVLPDRMVGGCTPDPRSACSRGYDPMPYDEAGPVDIKMYEGTGIGALYALPGCEDVVVELEGWTLAPRSVYE